jgi:hypothetical protein
VFYNQGDRYAHRIEAFDAAQAAWVTAFESLEGEPDDDWPPSPPFQQLHVEERPTGRVILLVGMAGRTHWSAAVEATVDRNGIAFDVAARYQTPPEYLGSNYPYVDSSSTSRLTWAANQKTILETNETFSDGPSIRPLGEFPSPPATVNWKYVVTCRDEA